MCVCESLVAGAILCKIHWVEENWLILIELQPTKINSLAVAVFCVLCSSPHTIKLNHFSTQHTEANQLTKLRKSQSIFQHTRVIDITFLFRVQFEVISDCTLFRTVPYRTQCPLIKTDLINNIKMHWQPKCNFIDSINCSNWHRYINKDIHKSMKQSVPIR